jgi:hypothetical protein
MLSLRSHRFVILTRRWALKDRDLLSVIYYLVCAAPTMLGLVTAGAFHIQVGLRHLVLVQAVPARVNR